MKRGKGCGLCTGQCERLVTGAECPYLGGVAVSASKVRFKVTLSKDEVQGLKVLAKRERRSISGIIGLLVQWELERKAKTAG